VKHVVQSSVEDDGGVTQRAEGDGHRDAAYCVVHNIMPHHDLERIGPGIAVHLEGYDRLQAFQSFVSVVYSDEGGVVDGRDAVPRRPTGQYGVEGHRVEAEVSLPTSGPYA
jgi:hypothetical protein